MSISRAKGLTVSMKNKRWRAEHRSMFLLNGVQCWRLQPTSLYTFSRAVRVQRKSKRSV